MWAQQYENERLDKIQNNKNKINKNECTEKLLGHITGTIQN